MTPPRSRIVLLALLALLACSASATASPGLTAPAKKVVKKKKARATKRSLTIAGNLLVNASFEGTTAGWASYNGAVSLAADGTDGANAALVRVPKRTRDGFSIYPTKAPVTASVAGETYSAGGLVRSAVAGRSLCLRLRESASGAEVGSKTVCVSGASAWQKFGDASYTAKASGDAIDVFVYEWNDQGGDSFEVDGLWLVRGSTPAPPPPPVPPANAPPVARATVVVTGMTAAFDASGSSDSDGTIASYAWTFGDGASGTGKTATHDYTGGTFTAKLTVTDDKGATATTDVPVSISVPAPPTPPLTGVAPWYSSTSPFNQRIDANAAVDPNSAAMVNGLVGGANGNFVIGAKEWTVPVYYADASTPRYNVALTVSWAPKRSLNGVPIPANAVPDPQGDHHMTIIDRTNDCEYDFWQASHNGSSWSASWGNATLTSGTGVYAGGWATTASGFANGLGKIRPEEINSGVINHALVFGAPNTRSGGPVLPATASDGRSSGAGTIPEGAHLQLDPNLDLSSLGLNAWQKVVARALQQYGMFLGDTGSAVGLSAVNAISFAGPNPYPWGDVSYAGLPASLLSHMRVLQMGPQYSPQGYLSPAPCASYS